MLRIPAFYLALAAILVSPRTYADLPRGVEIRAYLNESCVVSDEPYLLAADENDQIIRSLSVGSAVVGKLAHTLLGGFIRATSAQLGTMSKQRDMYHVAARDFELYQATFSESPQYELNSKLACATVVAADFESDNVDCSQHYVPKILPEMVIEPDEFVLRSIREDNSVENILRRANVCVRGAAHTIYEVRFEYSDDGTAYRLESAGLWVNSLLSTKSKKASRGIVYTMDIAEPAADSDMHVLSSAWVNVGEIAAGYASDSPPYSSRSGWLRVPSMSPGANKVYQLNTSVHQDVFGEIQALQRSVTRNRRQLDGMRQRLGTASDNIRATLQSEMDSLELRILRSESLLDAQRAEYEDLPRVAMNYMPVTLRFGVIESRSEKRALGTLAAYLENNSSRITDVAANQMGISKSADIDEMHDSDEPTTLELSRETYFDALVAFEESSAEGIADTGEVERNLVRARDQFNAARSAAGIERIQ